MFKRSTRRAWLAVLVLSATVACTTTPTSPSRSPEAAVGAAMPSSMSLTVNPPNALGALRFVAFGDSITYGTLSSFDGMALFDGESFAYPARLEGSLNANHAPYRFVVLNRGAPGEAVVDGARRIAGVLTADRPQALLLLEGINDLSDGVPLATIGASLQRVVDTSLQRGIPVFIATMFQTYEFVRPDGEVRTNGAPLIPAFNQRIRAIAGATPNVYLVDLYAAFGTNPAYVGADGLHPTTRGFDVMAVEFLRAIERAYGVRGSFQ